MVTEFLAYPEIADRRPTSSTDLRGNAETYRDYQVQYAFVTASGAAGRRAAAARPAARPARAADPRR